jgi:hypothetical protein
LDNKSSLSFLELVRKGISFWDSNRNLKGAFGKYEKWWQFYLRSTREKITKAMCALDRSDARGPLV